jgi:hypothetical protein
MSWHREANGEPPARKHLVTILCQTAACVAIGALLGFLFFSAA